MAYTATTRQEVQLSCENICKWRTWAGVSKAGHRQVGKKDHGETYKEQNGAMCQMNVCL